MIMCGRAGMALRLPEPFHHYRARGVEIRIAVFHTAAGAVGVDQLAGMAAEDVPFAGLGSPARRLVVSLDLAVPQLLWLPLGDCAALAGYRRVVQSLARAVPSRVSAMISYDCS